VVRRAFPDAIISEGVTREETPMLEETLIKYRERVRREADEIIRQGLREAVLEGRRKTLLEQMTLRFGRLPQKVRSQVEQIKSAQELRKLTRKILRAKSLKEMGFE
jgi:flagellar biosynthesis/type III secretory pathway protein FliH